MPADVFNKLLEFTYNGIAAPLTSFKEHGSHDQAEHKKTDRDGSTSEGTGRNAMVYTARVAFINGLARGVNETWSNLYPQTYNNFTNELLKRDTGFMAHPERGLLDVKVIEWDSELNADQRGGRYVDVTFRETNDETSVLATASFTSLSTAAADLTATLGALSPPLPITGADGLSLFDLIEDIASIGDELDLLEMKILGRIDNMISAVDGLFFVATTNPTILPKIAAVSQGLRETKSKLLTEDKPIGFHLTSRSQTTARLAKNLKNGLQDLIHLNPQIAGMAIVPVASVVRYYK